MGEIIYEKSATESITMLFVPILIANWLYIGHTYQIWDPAFFI